MMRLARSIVGPQEAEAVSRVLLEDGYLGMGKEVQRFEQELATYLGVSQHSVACVNSGTAAVHLAVQAVLNPGDEVLVQSLTFVATYQAISAAGAVPVSCEVRPETVTIDLTDAERRLTKKTKAIMPVHYASNPANLAEVFAFAKKHELRVIEDAAHAFGCQVEGKKIGSFGDIACFSFDGIKNITCGEGGAVVSSDPAVMQAVRDARLLGVENDSEKRFSGQRSWDFDVKKQGYRYHMSNLNAAIGRVQLGRLDSEFGPKRILLVDRYRQRLGGKKDVTLLAQGTDFVIPHLFAVKVGNGKRDLLKVELEKKGVPTGVHYKPNHLLSLYGGGKVSLAVTERLYGELLTLPLHPGLLETEINEVCDIISSVLDKN